MTECLGRWMHFLQLSSFTEAVIVATMNVDTLRMQENVHLSKHVHSIIAQLYPSS